MKLRLKKSILQNRAFTLIELLAVIAIIGIVAGMLLHLAPAAAQKRKVARADAELQKLTMHIESYKDKFGHYPPDNAALTNVNLSAAQYDLLTQVNPLLYELTGGSNFVSINNKSVFVTFNGSNISQGGPNEFASAYGLGGILNGDAQKDVVYRPLPKPTDYSAYPSWMLQKANINAADAADLQGLLVPVETVEFYDPANASGPGATTPFNFWHYDATSTNRHNLSGYDLWYVITLGRQKDGAWNYRTNGNFNN